MTCAIQIGGYDEVIRRCLRGNMMPVQLVFEDEEFATESTKVRAATAPACPHTLSLSLFLSLSLSLCLFPLLLYLYRSIYLSISISLVTPSSLCAIPT